MPFIPTQETARYVQSPPPILQGSERLHLDRELRKISQVIEKLASAVTEIQDYLKTLP